MLVGDFIIVDGDPWHHVIAYPGPKSAANVFPVPRGVLGIVLRVGDPSEGTYFGEVYVVLSNSGKTAWIPAVHLKTLELYRRGDEVTFNP